jgi:hypothetical protein
MADVWSYCAPCARWFYCPRATDGVMVLACPVCGAQGERTHDRSLTGLSLEGGRS